ncbi:hypothetical protein [Mucilaginibacter boryungensis]|uniref:pEK499-p136 HEPN domain-containing protein n=1 Tax=Mucilaginibacter boryungensis TaxID=768480 RepID=A0ABR9XDB4_9SPHI|nr:hypothetical protein [Mucilaginibacter boryungensis]MBE9665068.1 hypothetical protein [Mucilaginibacter boryungensis]
MEDDVKKATFEAIEKIGTFYRGSVINEWAKLEKCVELIITSHLSGDPQTRGKIAILLLGRMTFHAKKEVINTLLVNYNELYPNKQQKKSFTKYVDALGGVNRERNIFAHHILNTTDEGLQAFPDKIGYVEYKDGSLTHWYTQELFGKLIERILTIKDETMTLYNTLVPPANRK